MKILSVGINGLGNPRDGLPMYLSYFDLSAKQQGHDLVHFQFLTRQSGSGDAVNVEETIGGNPVVYINTPDLFNFSKSAVYTYKNAIIEFNKLIDKFKPDIVFLHDWMGVPLVNFVKKDFDVVYMAHLFNTELNNVLGIETSPVVGDGEYLGMEEIADFIIANSPQTEEGINKYFPQTKHKSFYVDLGVDKEKYIFAPNPLSKEIFYFGRLDPQKGINNLLYSYDKHKEELKKKGFIFKVAGDGMQLGEIARRHFAKDLKYLGQLGEVEKLEAIGNAKYCVFPSVYEPYGLALNEALSMGKLCIASKVGGHIEQIKDKKNGWFSDDPFGKILEIESKMTERKQLSIMKEARKQAKDIEDHFKILWRLIDEVIRNSD